MAYQSFPWEDGDSRSLQKLVSLRLPSLAGRSVLDIGCNSGFFCGFAKFAHASRVVGVDNNPDFLTDAEKFFPDCQFIRQDWLELGDEKFDIILFLSAIHYAPDQQAVLDLLMSRLKPGGLLVLEVGVASGAENAFVEVRRAIDSRFFPTQKKLDSMLAPYAVKFIGSGVSQAGDPVPRYVYHVRKKLPVAILMMDEPHSGKTFLGKRIFRDNITYISGDALYWDIRDDKYPGHEDIKKIIGEWAPGEAINCAAVTYHLGKNGLLPKLCDLACKIADGRDFLLDMYVSPPFRDKVGASLENNGFFVVDVALRNARARRPAMEDAGGALCQAYMESLQKNFLINEKDYLDANPDVRAALEKGHIPNAQYHYWHYGRKEGRPLKPA